MNSRADEIRNMSRHNALNEPADSSTSGESNIETVAGAESARVNCPVCDEDISARAKKCRYCGETLDVSMRIAEEARRASDHRGNVYMNAGSAAQRTPATHAHGSRTKSKIVAFALAWLLGGLGGHKFYLNRVGQGLLYLIFCWTFIPTVIAFIEGIVYLTMEDERFWEKYG